MEDRFDLERFVRAQEGQYEAVLAELRAGRKRSHWMWYFFPQMRGLGMSSMAYEYGIGSRAEAEEYLKHAALGPRLVKCTELVNAVEGSTAEGIFGGVDAMKFRSSMTLFAEVDAGNAVFQKALEKYYNGEKDEATLRLLG